MNKLTPTKQILETVRELREAQKYYLQNTHLDMCTWTKSSAFDSEVNPSIENETEALSANKMDQLCEAFEVCVEALNKISNTRYADYTDAEDICKQGLIVAAEILGKGE